MRNLNTGVSRNDSLILPEDLIAIDRTLREGVDLEAMIARQVAPPRTSDHRGVQRIEWRKVTREGAARLFNAHLSDDIPLIDLHTEPADQKVFSIVVGFHVSTPERDAADLTGADIVGQKTLTAQRQATILENDLFWNGSTPHNMQGLLNYTGIQTLTVPLNAGGTSRKWEDKTAAERLNDVMLAWSMIQLRDAYHATIAIFNTTDTKWLHMPYSDTVPTTIWELLQNRGWFLAGMLTTEKVPSGTFVVAQNTKDVLEYAMPMDLTRQEPFRIGSMKEEIAFHERYGGAICYRPLGVLVVSGIA